MYWCVKRAQLGNDFIKATPCQEGFIECWTGLCFNSSVGCPITYLQFANSTPANGSYVEYDGRYLVISRNQGARPLVSLTIQINGVPCLDPADTPSGSSDVYPLRRNQPNRCESYGQDTLASFAFDTQDEYQLNGENFGSISSLPYYDYYTYHTTTVLSGRTMLSLLNDSSCINIDADKLGQVSPNSDSYDFVTCFC